MGQVYLAEDLVTGKDIALKVLRPRPGMDPTALRRMVNEAAAAASVSHPGSVRTLHVDVSNDGRLYLLTDYVDGETLKSRLARGALGPGGAARLGQALGSVLAAAHARNVVHRDVKPQNVMLTNEEPGVKLLDFGISKVSEEIFEHEMTGTGQIVGTPAYMSPEQVSRRPVSGATDVYSLGLLVYEAAAGRGPFDFDNAMQAIAAHTVDVPKPLLLCAPATPPAMSDLVGRCLAKHPDDRPTAADVARALGEIADGLDASPATVL